MDRIEHQMLVLAQSIEQSATRLLQSYGYWPAAKTRRQLQCPGLNRLRGVLERSRFPFSATSSLKRPGVFAIGPVDGDKSGEIRLARRVHKGHLVSPPL